MADRCSRCGSPRDPAEVVVAEGMNRPTWCRWCIAWELERSHVVDDLDVDSPLSPPPPVLRHPPSPMS